MSKVRILPPSGPLGLVRIGGEFGDPEPIKILEDSAEALWAIKPELRDTPVKFSQFYGIQDTLVIELTDTYKNVNIEAIANERGKNDVKTIFVNVRHSARIGSTSEAAPALRTGNFSNGAADAVIWLNIENGAQIYGRGGNGGAGAPRGQSGTKYIPGETGHHGSNSIRMEGQGTLRINNSGSCAGGGGGGGGGAGGHLEGGYGARGGVGDPSGTTGPNGQTPTYPGADGGDLGEFGEDAENNLALRGGYGGGAGYSVEIISGTVIYDKVGDMRGYRDGMQEYFYSGEISNTSYGYSSYPPLNIGSMTRPEFNKYYIYSISASTFWASAFIKGFESADFLYLNVPAINKKVKLLRRDVLGIIQYISAGYEDEIYNYFKDNMGTPLIVFLTYS